MTSFKKSIFIVLPWLFISLKAMAASVISGKLPVLYVNTQGGVEITSKEDYVSGTYWLDSLGHSEYRSVGSQAAPLPLQIRGRGNWTWTGFDKKPYRIKLDAGQKLCGMQKSKHWALMAGADDNLGYLRNTTGYFLSKRIGLQWTPEQVPVELVLNGRYWGVYFLTETIRVDNKRVNINEQADGSTHPDSITGGWLVEIDNYSSEGNINFQEGNGQHVMVSIKSPEATLLSAPQRNYITQQIASLNSAIYASSSTQLEQLIDIDEAARFYLVQEIMEDCESYHGSCYMYKDMDATGAVSPWMFGPVWDFGNAYRRGQNRFIYDRPEFEQYWIGRLAQHPVFQARLMVHWYTFYHSGQYDVRQWISDFVGQLSDAPKNDASRWRNTKNYCDNSDMANRKREFMNKFNSRIQWLYSQWGEGTPDTEDALPEQEAALSGDNTARVVVQNGQIVILRAGKRYTLLGAEF